MIGGTARHNMNLAHRADLLIGHVKLLDDNIVILNAGQDRIGHGLWLLVHLLQHEMLIPCLLSSAGIPVNKDRLLRSLLLVHRIEVHVIRPQAHHLLIIHIINFPGIFQNRRHIRSDKAAFLILPYNQRGILSGRENLVGTVRKKNAQRIRAFHTVKHLCDRLKRIPFIIVIKQMGQHLRIRLRHKMIPLVREHFAQLDIILNNTVMYHGNRFRLIEMRMCVCVARHAVCRPPCMPDAADSRHGLPAPGDIFQNLKASHRFGDIDLSPAVINGHTCRVIPPVFQFRQTVQNDRCRLLCSDISYNSTH